MDRRHIHGSSIPYGGMSVFNEITLILFSLFLFFITNGNYAPPKRSGKDYEYDLNFFLQTLRIYAYENALKPKGTLSGFSLWFE